MRAPRHAPVKRRGTFRVRWHIAARLARRQVRRTIVSSLLITALVALPIAGMTAYAIVAFSLNGTSEEKARVELGQMDAWVSVAGVPDAGFFQAPTEPTWYGYPPARDGSPVEPEGTLIEDPTTLLPSGTETIPVVEGQVGVATADGVAVLPAWAGKTWDEMFAGRFDIVAGERPQNTGEAMVTPAALERLGVSLGDKVKLSDGGDEVTVVGTMKSATLADSDAAVFLPAGAHIGGETRWYLPTQALSWPDVHTLNEHGVIAYSRDVVLNPPEHVSDDMQNFYDSTQGAIWTVVLLLSVAGAFAAYVVVMLAGAAFAVAARRQQRTLAVAASVGASAGDLRRTVLLQGTVLGLIGGVTGVVLGVGVAALTMQLTADGSATQYWGIHIPWPILAVILVFAVLVGTASAAMPARTVARSDVLSALRGGRRPQKPKTSRPVWGSVILLIGVGITIGAALVMAAVNATDVPYDSPLRVVPPFGIVVGPILVQLGILLSGSWLLWIASLGLSRLGLAARLASRDAAAHASRTVPAFAAIAATVFIAVFAVGQMSMQTSLTARNWGYAAPLHALSIVFYPSGNSALIEPDAAASASETALELTDTAGAQSTAVIEKQHPPYYASSVEELDANSPWIIAVLPDRHLLDPEVENSFTYSGQDPANPVSVIDASEVETAMGVDLTAAQLSAYRDGAAIVADPRFSTDGEVEFAAWTAIEAYEGVVPNNIWLPFDDLPDVVAPLWRESLFAIVLDVPHQPTAIAIAPATAAELGIVAQPTQIIASFATPPGTDDLDRIQAQALTSSTTQATFAPYYEQGPPGNAFWIVPILIAVSVLVLGASAVALGLARFERRPDDATLSAVGGTRGLRRRISFWQGLIIAGFGTVAGAVAGILPPVGFSIQSRGTLLVDDIPWLTLGLIVVSLPLAIALVSWLVLPRAPDLTRRTAIA